MKLKGNSILLVMNKFYKLLILILFPIIFINCSFNNQAGIWKDLSKESVIKKERSKYKPLFIKGEKFKKEISNDIVINISKSITFIDAKIAISKDYFTINKNSKWITNSLSRNRAHLIRSEYEAIISTSKSISIAI